MDEKQEMRRMLEHFKANLPPHELSEWRIEAQPLPPRIQIEGEPHKLPEGFLPQREWTRYRIEGHATCSRCGRRFEIDSKWGNAYAVDEADIESTAEAMKTSVRRDAHRAGPCWGDVPEVPDHEREAFAVLDSAMT